MVHINVTTAFYLVLLVPRLNSIHCIKTNDYNLICPTPLCLSVPFPHEPQYTLEDENPSQMSLCCYAKDNGKKLLGAERYAEYFLVGGQSLENKVEMTFDVKLSNDINVTQKYAVSQYGVDIHLSGAENLGFMVPVFDFDGSNHTMITITENEITITYQGAVCRYQFNGTINPAFQYFYNRNGKYRVYEIATKELHIEMECANI